MQSNRPVDVGLRAPLHLGICGQSLMTEVVVTRVSPSSGGRVYEIGATFVAIRPEDRLLIEGFIGE